MHSIETIEEIRKDRIEISRKCDFDPKKLIAFYMERKTKIANKTDPQVPPLGQPKK
jgi:hypothetical protein